MGLSRCVYVLITASMLALPASEGKLHDMAPSEVEKLIGGDEHVLVLICTVGNFQCKEQKPLLQQVAEKYTEVDKIKFVWVNGGKHPEFAEKQAARQFPAFRWFRPGEKKGNRWGEVMHSGGDPIKDFMTMVHKWLGKDHDEL